MSGFSSHSKELQIRRRLGFVVRNKRASFYKQAFKYMFCHKKANFDKDLPVNHEKKLLMVKVHLISTYYWTLLPYSS